MIMKRGFTLLELAVVVSILGVVTPTAFAVWRHIDDEQRLSVARLGAVAAVRGIGDDLRRDARNRTWATRATTADDVGVALDGGATCKRVVYRVDRSALFRDACGDVRALARHVASIARTGDAVTVTFRLPGATRPTPFVIGVHPGGAP